MRRRNFLSGLGVTALALGTTALRVGGCKSVMEYKGYAIGWTGWKSAFDSTRLVGQWLAAPNSDIRLPLLFASVPGWHGVYRKGECFNTQVFFDEGQILIETITPENIKEQQRQQGFTVIKNLIDQTAG